MALDQGLDRAVKALGQVEEVGGRVTPDHLHRVMCRADQGQAEHSAAVGVDQPGGATDRLSLKPDIAQVVDMVAREHEGVCERRRIERRVRFDDQAEIEIAAQDLGPDLAMAEKAGNLGRGEGEGVGGGEKPRADSGRERGGGEGRALDHGPEVTLQPARVETMACLFALGGVTRAVQGKGAPGHALRRLGSSLRRI